MKQIFLFYLLFLIYTVEMAYERKLKMINSNDVIYVSALGRADTLHYLWTTVGNPSVLIVKTDNDAQIDIDYKKLFSQDPSKSISFNNGTVLNSFGVIFNRFFEFDDENDTGNISVANQSYSVTTTHMDSSFIEITENTSQEVNFLFNSSLLLQISHRKGEMRHSTLPHLLYTANCSQVEMLINHDAIYNKSRLGVEMFFFSKASKTSKMDFKNHKSIDDEYTPGIFKLSELKAPKGLLDPKYTGYIQWRPLSYLSPNRLVTDITLLETYPIINGEMNETESPIIKAFYYNSSIVMIQKTNFTFGLKGSDFYKNFLSWTIIIGLGIPAEDPISLGIISILAIVLGLPVVIFVGGIIFLKIKKKQAQPKIRSMYEAIN